MSETITVEMLEKRVEYLNTLIPGKTYELERAYGGFKLVNSTGSRTILPTGFTSKKKLFYCIDSMIVGIREAQDE